MQNFCDMWFWFVLLFRLSAELTAFSSGLDILWNVVKTNKDVLRPLFVYEHSPLSLLQLRKLYCIQWSENVVSLCFGICSLRGRLYFIRDKT